MVGHHSGGERRPAGRRRRFGQPGIVVILLACFVAGGRPTQKPGAELLWDEYGVPHIYAATSAELFRALGWAQMESHGNLILRLYGQARGRAAEYWGASYVDSDRWVRVNHIPRLGARSFEQQSNQFAAYLEAFAEGMNAYARENPERIAEEVRPVLPIAPADVLAHVVRVIHFSFLTSPAQSRAAGGALTRPGSNGWAVSRARSASGNTLLLANPHLPWSDLYLFYEAHLVSPDIEAYGVTLVGFPVLGIGFNRQLGWTHTVNTIDAADYFELTRSGDGYLFDGQVRQFETESETLKVKEADGSLRSVNLDIRSSVHGPVVQETPQKALALRVASLDNPGLCEQWWDMARAQSLSTFESVLKRLQLPLFTVLYADRDGHILHLYNGRVPVRPDGYDWSGVVPGDTSKTLWTKTHPYSDLPRVVDPSTGWLQNSNDGPWSTTIPMPLSRQKFPPYFGPSGMSLRAQRSAKLLASDSSITLQELIDYKHSTRIELADRILEELIEAARSHPSEDVRAAAETLRKWDRNADAGSRGAVLFDEFIRRWNESPDKTFARQWDEAVPLETPRGVQDPARALRALEQAVEGLRSKGRTVDVPWGEVFRFRRAGVDLPGNGAPGEPFGAVRVIRFSPDADGKYVASFGDSFVAAIEFSDPPRAMAAMTYGNATQPGSPHATDQLILASEKRLRPVWLNRPDVERHTRSRKVF